MADDPLIALFTTWRAEIDQVPFAHESESEEIVRTLLAETGRPR